jgi:hypothetical protein
MSAGASNEIAAGESAAEPLGFAQKQAERLKSQTNPRDYRVKGQ